MGFLDLFRPKWRHSDPDVRAEAVKHLGDGDEALIARVARQDPDAKVRKLALKKISDPSVLDEIARGDGDDALRKAAGEKASQLLLAQATRAGDPAAALAALARISSPKAVVEVARRAAEVEVRQRALAGISDEQALGEVARRAEDPAIRRQAVERLKDEATLREVALADGAKEVALAAVARIHHLPTLEQIAQKAKAKGARESARQRTSAVHKPEERKAPVADATPDAKRRARRAQLCGLAERASLRDDLEAGQAELDGLRGEWIELGVSEDELQKRFDRAVAAIGARREEREAKLRVRAEESRVADEERVSPAPAATVTETPAPPRAREPRAAAPVLEESKAAEVRARLEALVAEAEKLSGSPKQVDSRLRGIEKEFRIAAAAGVTDDALRARLSSVMARLATLRADEESARAREADSALARIAELVTGLEALGEADGLKRTEQQLKVTQDAFSSLPPVPREKLAPLKARYDAARAAVAGRVAELRETEQWKRWANVPRFEALCVRAEKLVEAVAVDGADLKQAAADLKAAQAEWKQVGAGPKERSEQLWQRFKTAGDKVHARVVGQRAGSDEERAANLVKKEELCAAAEALESAPDLSDTAAKVKELQAQWKAIGPVAKEKSDELWKRFRGACDRFFARIGEDRSGKKRQLEELIAKVEAVAGSTEWKATAEVIKGYQAEWKGVTGVPRGESQELYARFRDACDRFFDRRKAEFEKADGERAENLAKKVTLCERAEALVVDEKLDVPAKQSEAKRLQAEWKSIGPVPRDQGDAIWARFRGTCDKVFAREEAPDDDATGKPLEDVPAELLGTKGFTNRLPLEGLLAKSRDPVAVPAPERVPTSERLPPVAQPVREPPAPVIVPPPVQEPPKPAPAPVEEPPKPTVPSVDEPGDKQPERLASPGTATRPSVPSLDEGWAVDPAPAAPKPAQASTPSVAPPMQEVDAGWGEIDLEKK